jgi:hypothetical protein
MLSAILRVVYVGDVSAGAGHRHLHAASCCCAGPALFPGGRDHASIRRPSSSSSSSSSPPIQTSSLRRSTLPRTTWACAPPSVPVCLTLTSSGNSRPAPFDNTRAALPGTRFPTLWRDGRPDRRRWASHLLPCSVALDLDHLHACVEMCSPDLEMDLSIGSSASYWTGFPTLNGRGPFYPPSRRFVPQCLTEEKERRSTVPSFRLRSTTCCKACCTGIPRVPTAH